METRMKRGDATWQKFLFCCSALGGGSVQLIAGQVLYCVGKAWTACEEKPEQAS